MCDSRMFQCMLLVYAGETVVSLMGIIRVFVIQEFCFNPSASTFLPTTCSSFSSSRLTAMDSETSPMAAQLPCIQPSWNQAELPQSGWSNVYQHEPTFQQYDSTVCFATNEMDARSAGFQQQGSLSCPVDWYLDNTRNPQALQSLLSFQVGSYFVLPGLTFRCCEWRRKFRLKKKISHRPLRSVARDLISSVALWDGEGWPQLS